LRGLRERFDKRGGLVLLLEINIGLLGAVAIVASLLGIVFEGKFYNRWIAYAVGGFGVSAFLSSVVLLDIVRSSLLTGPADTVWQTWMTYLAMAFFLFSTEVLVLLSIRKFWKLGKIEKRR
jgi:hypothetical protein